MFDSKETDPVRSSEVVRSSATKYVSSKEQDVQQSKETEVIKSLDSDRSEFVGDSIISPVVGPVHRTQ